MENIISIREFKNNCYPIIEEIQKTNQTLLITHKHSLIAKLIPVNGNSRDSILDLMRGKAELTTTFIKQANKLNIDL